MGLGTPNGVERGGTEIGTRSLGTWVVCVGER